MPFHTPNRGYQESSYSQSEALQDRQSRHSKARKILHLLDDSGMLPRPKSLGTLLDIGCSNGAMTEVFLPFAQQVIGLEYDAEALEHSDPELRQQALLIQGDAMAVPLRDESIDLIVCAQVYEHVPNDERLVDEIYRVLKPGGIVCFSGPNWLFPIELHYGLPFLHWLPRPFADGLLRTLNRDDQYYERSRSWWGLKRLLGQFEITDVTAEATRFVLGGHSHHGVRSLRRVPIWLLRLLGPIAPNVNWLLRKRPSKPPTT